MYTVQIDTTVAKIAKITLLDDKDKIAESEKVSPLLAIKTALETANLPLTKVDKFESHSGPGSYTGLRVGAAVANTLNWILGKNYPLIEPIYE